MHYLDEAKDRVLMGPARTGGRIPDEEANRNTAYHEAGHTLVSIYTKDATPLHKVRVFIIFFSKYLLFRIIIS